VTDLPLYDYLFIHALNDILHNPRQHNHKDNKLPASHTDMHQHQHAAKNQIQEKKDTAKAQKCFHILNKVLHHDTQLCFRVPIVSAIQEEPQKRKY
jgi:hypothetical protein